MKIRSGGWKEQTLGWWPVSQRHKVPFPVLRSFKKTGFHAAFAMNFLYVNGQLYWDPSTTPWLYLRHSRSAIFFSSLLLQIFAYLHGTIMHIHTQHQHVHYSITAHRHIWDADTCLYKLMGTHIMRQHQAPLRSTYCTLIEHHPTLLLFFFFFLHLMDLCFFSFIWTSHAVCNTSYTHKLWAH